MKLRKLVNHPHFALWYAMGSVVIVGLVFLLIFTVDIENKQDNITKITELLSDCATNDSLTVLSINLLIERIEILETERR